MGKSVARSGLSHSSPLLYGLADSGTFGFRVQAPHSGLSPEMGERSGAFRFWVLRLGFGHLGSGQMTGVQGVRTCSRFNPKPKSQILNLGGKTPER